jgi:hypothetical protein
MKRFVFFAVPVALVLGGCASLPQTGVVTATGEPLRVESGTVIDEVKVKEKVGEVTHTDGAGRSVGRSEVYADRTKLVEREVWKTYQGARPLDDHDFFRLAGDKDAAAQIQESRETGVTLNHVGLGLLVGGVAAFVASYVVRSDDPMSSNTFPTVLMVGGGLAATAGGILTWLGLSKAKAEHPLDDRGRAMDAARNYNTRLGVQ